MTGWTDQDSDRIRALREMSHRRPLTVEEVRELRELRRRETNEAHRRRVAFYRRNGL